MAVTPNSIVTPQTIPTWTMGVIVSTAMTGSKAYDGTETAGTALALIATAGANGARAEKLIVKIGSTAGGTPAATTTATMLRVWLNNGSANTTATNNSLIAELAIAAFAVSTTAISPAYEIPLNITIPAGYRLYGGLTAAIGATAAAVAITPVIYDL
jgi:hypothetical protein